MWERAVWCYPGLVSPVLWLYSVGGYFSYHFVHLHNFQREWSDFVGWNQAKGKKMRETTNRTKGRRQWSSIPTGWVKLSNNQLDKWGWVDAGGIKQDGCLLTFHVESAVGFVWWIFFGMDRLDKKIIKLGKQWIEQKEEGSGQVYQRVGQSYRIINWIMGVSRCRW